MVDNFLGYEHMLTPRGINGIRQNKPVLIARDLERLGVPFGVSMDILLARGVFKWLAVRRDLIRLKNSWRARVRGTLASLRAAKRSGCAYQVGYLRGYLRALEECRAEVRSLCHSDRWQAPDFDRAANEHLTARFSMAVQRDNDGQPDDD